MSIKDKIKSCLKEGSTKERHKGLRKVNFSQEAITNHLQKAAHNLNAIIDFKKAGYSDWSASAAFYALYHCLLALLLKHGYESRNQSCTFAFVENLINEGKIELKIEDLKEIFDRDVTENIQNSGKILDIRESMQYSFKTSLEDKEFQRLWKRTKELFDKIKQEVEK